VAVHLLRSIPGVGKILALVIFSEAACLFLRRNERAKYYQQKLVCKYGKAKALSIIAQKLGRCVYSMLKRRSLSIQNCSLKQ
jgi:hypothetical protein